MRSLSVSVSAHCAYSINNENLYSQGKPVAAT